MGITRESTVTVVSSLAGLRSLSGGKLMPGPQRLGDGPRLRDAPPWCKRRIAIEDLGDRPEPVVAEMMRHWREEGACRLGVAVHLEVRERERAEEERPHRALMISAVAVPLIAAVLALVLRVAGRKTPQPVGRQEMARAGVDDLALAFERERALAERDCEDLVWPERVIVAVGRVDDVVTTPDAFIPEATESRPHARGEFVPWPERQPQSFREAGHRAERVVPERVDLDRLASAWRDDPVTTRDPSPARAPGGRRDGGLGRCIPARHARLQPLGGRARIRRVLAGDGSRTLQRRRHGRAAGTAPRPARLKRSGGDRARRRAARGSAGRRRSRLRARRARHRQHHPGALQLCGASPGRATRPGTSGGGDDRLPGFLAGPPLIGVVAEAAGLVAGLGLVSGACAFVALKAGALPEASTPRTSVTAGAHSTAASAVRVQDSCLAARSAMERKA